MEKANLSIQGAQYVKLFDELRQETGDTESALAILEQIGKDRRVQAMAGRVFANGSKNPESRNDGRPSEKQLQFARDLGLDVPDNATRQEVSALLDQALAR